MSSVLTAQNCLKYLISSKKIFKVNAKKQDKSYEIRYSKNKEFNNKSVKKFSKFKKTNFKNIFNKNHHLKDLLINPYYFNKNND